MRTTVPDEEGWYWTKHAADDRWRMAFVDTNLEKVWIIDDWIDWNLLELHDFPPDLIIAWYGPFTCPGGDFGGNTVVSDEELNAKAAMERKVIGITHFDFKHCDGGSHASISISGLYSREEAEERIRREV